MRTLRKKPLWILALAALLAITLGLGLTCMVPNAQAAKTVTAHATVVMSGPRPTLYPAGDNAAHLVGVGKRTGKVVFKDGRKAKYSNVFILDLFRGKSVEVWGYTKMQFKDGSWIFFKWDSEFTGRDKAGKPTFKGTGKILKGTGTYKGITGSVKYKNRRLPPSKEHPQGATEAKAVLTYTLP